MILNNSTKFNTLEYYRQFVEDIPDKSGVYYWVYWPFRDTDADSDDIDLLLEHIRIFTITNLNLAEASNTGYKFNVIVQEIRFSGDEIFGLNNSKKTKLLAFLKESKRNRDYFLQFLKKISFSRPFYIGKADNLKQRLSQHFQRRNSEILVQLENQNIRGSDVLIGYEIIENDYDQNVNVILEEIAQRIIKPGLTKRPG
ncbi:GIY-YIG nuclease family protein [Thalassotalea mangrovi]|uniref:Uncharacterized protein n=1 Tax=Thalassotalea mangrovi TaxID=2572245 RepID=A0A4U1B7W4_9GAMM|nr:GIY-YIG nuclease family protein [Thalassotalea mangrovi]TKB46332.1 hypothetical protein E8M12_04570 [Thalassotalea mangrovi]